MTPSDLTPREREVAGLVAHGLTDKAIAARLGISPATVARHLDNIGAKVGHDPDRTRRTVIKRMMEAA